MASNLRVDSIVPATGSSVSIGTATGGVNIPGVLTYEDVTNVDSIGIVTARSGIRVTSTTAGIAVGTNAMVSGRADNVLHLHKASGGTADGPTIYFTNQQTGVTGSDGLTIGLNDTQSPYIWNRENTATRFGTNNAERLRIGPAGQIGLGGANYGSSGQVLTSQGSGSAVQWANAGGITHARGYRLNNTPDASGGTIDLTNWAYENSAFNGHLGSGWSLPSSGVFTFPTTGIYDVSMMGMMRQLNDSNAWCGVQGKATTNNSSYNIAFECYQQIVQASGSSNQYVNFYGHCILDVTNTSNVKFKVSFFADQNEQVYLHGGGSYNQTALKFTRLGDT